MLMVLIPTQHRSKKVTFTFRGESPQIFALSIKHCLVTKMSRKDNTHIIGFTLSANIYFTISPYINLSNIHRLHVGTRLESTGNYFGTTAIIFAVKFFTNFLEPPAGYPLI